MSATLIKISYARETFLSADVRFAFMGGRALCPDGVVRTLKRVHPDAVETVTGASVRAAVEKSGKTITGTLSLIRPTLDDPNADPLAFIPDPSGRNAHLFA